MNVRIDKFIRKFGQKKLCNLVRKLNFIDTPVLLFDNIYLECKSESSPICFFDLYKRTIEKGFLRDKIKNEFIFGIICFSSSNTIYIDKLIDEVTAEKIIRYLLKKVDT